MYGIGGGMYIWHSRLIRWNCGGVKERPMERYVSQFLSITSHSVGWPCKQITDVEVLSPWPSITLVSSPSPPLSQMSLLEIPRWEQFLMGVSVCDLLHLHLQSPVDINACS